MKSKRISSFKLTPLSYILIGVILVVRFVNEITFNVQIPFINLITSIIILGAGLNIIFRYVEYQSKQETQKGTKGNN